MSNTLTFVLSHWYESQVHVWVVPPYDADRPSDPDPGVVDVVLAVVGSNQLLVLIQPERDDLVNGLVV